MICLFIVHFFVYFSIYFLFTQSRYFYYYFYYTIIFIYHFLSSCLISSLPIFLTILITFFVLINLFSLRRAAVGTCHGFAAYDYHFGKVSLVKCTISPTGKSGKLCFNSHSIEEISFD